MNIKEVRTKNHLTQSQVVALTGVPLRTLQSWEIGERKCPDYVERFIIEKIEQECPVKVYLINWEDEDGNYHDDFIQALTPEQAIETLGVPMKMVRDVLVRIEKYCC